MATKAEIAAQIAELNKQLETASDDEDVELHVERDGTRAVLKGRHAKKFLKQLGLEDEEPADTGQGDAPGDGDQGDGDGDGDQGDAKPGDAHRYFRK